MTRFLTAGFVGGAALGAYGNLFGLPALGLVVLCGIVGMLASGTAYVAARVDRARLASLLGELDV